MIEYVPEVIFFKSFDSYYFKYKGFNYVLDKNNLEYLKSVLTIPCAVEFYGCNISIIREIINTLKEEKAFTKLCKSESDEETCQVILLNSVHQLKMIKKI